MVKIFFGAFEKVQINATVVMLRPGNYMLPPPFRVSFSVASPPGRVRGLLRGCRTSRVPGGSRGGRHFQPMFNLISLPD